MPPWQTAHVRSTRERVTALVLLASANRVDTSPSLTVLMVAGADDGRRASGRVAVVAASRSESRQRGQRHSHECGTEHRHFQRRARSHGPTSCPRVLSLGVYTTRAKAVPHAHYGNVAILTSRFVIAASKTGSLPDRLG